MMRYRVGLLLVSFALAAVGLAPVSRGAELPLATPNLQAAIPGGLIVHAGCRDAGLLLKLAQETNILAQALVRTPEQLEAVRGQLRQAGVYGRVSARLWDGTFLPYADGMVNLLLATDADTALAQAEVERVLAPLGQARVWRNGALATFNKPWPAELDDWSHARYDATGNAVSRDQRSGPPRFLQWDALPRWNHSVKTSGLVSSRGRIFYILDDSHFASSERTWSVIARDGRNGVQLWRHQLPNWGGAKLGKKVGPAQMNRRLVAQGERVYATLGELAPVSVLNAADGKILRTLDATGPAEELLVSDGVLVTLVNAGKPLDFWIAPLRRKRIVAADPETGRTLWSHAGTVLPMTLAADGHQVVFHDGQSIVSLDLRTGAPRWTSSPTGQKIEFRNESNADKPGSEKSTIVLAPQFAPTLIIYRNVVSFAGGRTLITVSAENGRELWRSDYAASDYSVPVDVFGFDGLLWGPEPTMNFWQPRNDDLAVMAFDPQTGAVSKQVKSSYGFHFQHHRCHQMKVVNGQVLSGRAGIEFLNPQTGEVAAQHWTRGSCYYGTMPANGLLYVPPHDCACFIRAKLSGFLAMKFEAPARAVEIPEAQRLEKGPAFAPTQGQETIDSADWPTYRHDAGRSGSTSVRVAPQLKTGWQSSVGPKLTSPVVAGGRVFAASQEDHTLHALDAATGKPLWQRTLNARIDSPPTIRNGLVLCGARDGSVQALRAQDGALVWRYQASPEERWIVSRGQLESVWPVNGSILVISNTAYFAAGRSSYLDGGLRFCGLDLQTGQKLVDRRLTTLNPQGCELLDDQGVEGFLNDVLSSNGRQIFMRHQTLDFAGATLTNRIPHLHGPDGYLSGDTTSRLLWTYAAGYTTPHQGAFYDLRLSRVVFPAGRILSESDEMIYGFGQNHYGKLNDQPGGQWALFAAEKKSSAPAGLTAVEYRKLAQSGQASVRFSWWKQIPIQVWAMVLTPDVLFVAGPPQEDGHVAPEALEGKTAGSLLAISPKDGQVLSEVKLPAAPAWDGMAAAANKLFVTLANGTTLCLQAEK